METMVTQMHLNVIFKHTLPLLFIFYTYQLFLLMCARFSHLFFAQSIHHEHSTDLVVHHIIRKSG